MKLKHIALSKAITVQGYAPQARKAFRNVEANLNQHGIAIPMDKSSDELLIPWGLVDYIVRERQVQK